jgi:DNA-binding NtrC family response regulator
MNTPDLLSPPDQDRVLIVDYDKVTRDTLKTIFRLSGLNAESASSGEAGLNLLAGWKADLVISEILLDGMNGLDFAIKAVALNPDCRVILWAGQVSGHIVVEATALGFNFLDKPVNPKVLLDCAAGMLSETVARPALESVSRVTAPLLHKNAPCGDEKCTRTYLEFALSCTELPRRRRVVAGLE